MKTVLLTEDNEDLVELIQFHLEKEGYRVLVAKNGTKAIRYLKDTPINIVILDLMIPEINGLEVLTYMKKQPRLKDIPVIIESAKSEDVDVVKGLEMGADDYVTKPFSPKVLMARVKKVLSRQERKTEYYWSAYNFSIDTESREITLDNKPIQATQIEFDILVFLARNAGRVLSRDQILEGVWKNEVYVVNRVIDVHLTSLRKKLQSASGLIQTVRGVGYKMEPPKNEA